MWSTLLLTLALSADGFFVGLSYGIRGITMPPGSLGILGLCTLIGMSSSMALGGLVHDLVSPSSARGLGGALFVCLGLWQLWQGYHQYWQSANTPDEKNGVTLLARLHLRPLGIVIQILHEPVRADRDRSGSIEAGEAIALGVALGLDTLAAGFGASLAGFGTVVLLMVPLGLLALTWCGLLLGRACGKWLQKINSLALTGTLLILIGLLQMR